MGKRIIYSTLFIFFTGYCIAQINLSKPNSVFIEIGGVGGIFSINYERAINFTDNFGLVGGVGFNPGLADLEFLPQLPIQTKLFYQFKKHTIEAGSAWTPYVHYNTERSLGENLKKVELAVLAQIGYKYSVFEQRFFVGAAFTPLIYDLEFGFYPWGSLSFGYRF